MDQLFFTTLTCPLFLLSVPLTGYNNEFEHHTQLQLLLHTWPGIISFYLPLRTKITQWNCFRSPSTELKRKLCHVSLSAVTLPLWLCVFAKKFRGKAVFLVSSWFSHPDMTTILKASYHSICELRSRLNKLIYINKSKVNWVIAAVNLSLNWDPHLNLIYGPLLTM